MEYQLSPPILAAEFGRLGDAIKEVEAAGVKWLHIDIMDGQFVPTISMGIPIVSSIRKLTDMFFDVHIMANEPAHLIEEFARAGADMITVHTEACAHLDRMLNLIHQNGCRAGVALNPATPVCMLENILELADMVLVMTVNPGFGGQKYIPYCTEKIRSVRKMAEERGLQLDIEVDRGINRDTIGTVLDAGANIIVAGSTVFGGNIRENARELKEMMER